MYIFHAFLKQKRDNSLTQTILSFFFSCSFCASSLMDFDAKFREKFSFSSSSSSNNNNHNYNFPLVFHENFSKQRDEQFTTLEGFSSTNNNNLLVQDYLQPLENINFNLNNGSSSSSSSNALIPIIQTNFLESSFDNSTFGFLPTYYDFYESKPNFGNHHQAISNDGILVPLMENFNQSGGASVGILGHPQIMNNVSPIINMINPNSQNYNNSSNNNNSNNNNNKPYISLFEFGTQKYRALDEFSCTTSKTVVANTLSTTTMTATTVMRKGGRGRKKKPNVVKGQWTIEEDRLLTELVERYGVRKWSQIARLLNGRIGKQCRERWHNHLRPDIKKDLWSEEEDKILIKAHTEIGNKWAEIAKKLPGRTENSIKNHWNATKRRQFSKRKCRTKFPRQSCLLQEYIKSLTPETINAGCRKKPPSTIIHHHYPPLLTNSLNNNNNNNNNEEITNNLSSNSSSSDQLRPEFDFSEVPDFNFDAPMFEESSIESLLDYNNDDDHHHYHQQEEEEEEGQCSFEILNDDALIDEVVKCELDLVEMINQVNL